MATLPSEQGAGRDLAVEHALIDAARALTSHLDLDGVCSAILDAVERVFGATASWIVLHDPATDALRTRMFRGAGSAAYRDLALATDAGVLGLAFSRRKVVFVPLQEEDRWFDVARVQKSGLRSVFMVPLISQNAAIGVVGVKARDRQAMRHSLSVAREAPPEMSGTTRSIRSVRPSSSTR